jgi:hypothetical protein
VTTAVTNEEVGGDLRALPIRAICPCRRIAASPPAAATTDQAAAASIASGRAGESQVTRRTRGAAAWALPSVALALVPKCPMCVAAYLAIGSGLGVSLTTAAHLRTALVWLCWSTLALLAARMVARIWTRHSSRIATAPGVRRDGVRRDGMRGAAVRRAARRSPAYTTAA